MRLRDFLFKMKRAEPTGAFVDVRASCQTPTTRVRAYVVRKEGAHEGTCSLESTHNRRRSACSRAADRTHNRRRAGQGAGEGQRRRGQAHTFSKRARESAGGEGREASDSCLDFCLFLERSRRPKSTVYIVILSNRCCKKLNRGSERYKVGNVPAASSACLPAARAAPAAQASSSACLSPPVQK